MKTYRTAQGVLLSALWGPKWEGTIVGTILVGCILSYPPAHSECCKKLPPSPRQPGVVTALSSSGSGALTSLAGFCKIPC